MDFLNQNEWVARGEELADQITRRSKHILPHLGRFCLVSTFIEDGFRMYYQWTQQIDYLASIWSVPRIFATIFIFYNLIAQLSASGMALLKFKSNIACGILFSVVVLQTIVYNIFTDYHFLIRNFALCGSLLLLLVRQEDNKRLLAGIPSMHNDHGNNYAQLVARIMLVMMFGTLVKLEFSFMNLLLLVGGGALILMVTIGYKTKLSALVLVTWLFLFNMTSHQFWAVSSHSYEHDFLKFDFFQTLSVIGGLILVVAFGPGGVSVDEHKKAW